MPTDLSYKWGGVGYLLGVISILLCASTIVFAWIRSDTSIGSARHLEDDDEVPTSVSAPAATAGNQFESARTVHVSISVSAAADAGMELEKGDFSHGPTGHHSLDASTVLPFAPASVAFRDMSYTVPLPGGGQKVLLHRVSGYAIPGRITALMGASGAGKTTLLDVLAGRKNSGKMGGEMFLCGRPKAANFNRQVAYCEQQVS
jgi:ABC-type glutathione transport system ATPase component